MKTNMNTTNNNSLYAFVCAENGAFELLIGKQVEGNPSHGSAMPVGVFASVDEAKQHAIGKGVDVSKIYV